MPGFSTNIDPDEIAKFEGLASRWWDPNGEFKPLHDINPLRLNYIKERVNLDNKTVLDVGCGGGILAESMAALGAKVMAIDMGEAPLSVARLHLKESGLSVDYQQTTAEELVTQKPDSFDVITCMELLEHVPDPASTVTACAQLVKPCGHVFFSTINRHPKAWLFAIIGAEYILNLLPRGTHRYENFIKPSELEDWARQSGLSFRHLIGMHYNPVIQRYWLAPGPDVNYIAHTTRPDD